MAPAQYEYERLHINKSNSSIENLPTVALFHLLVESHATSHSIVVALNNLIVNFAW